MVGYSREDLKYHRNIDDKAIGSSWWSRIIIQDELSNMTKAASIHKIHHDNFLKG
jgi:hypothetical protein